MLKPPRLALPFKPHWNAAQKAVADAEKAVEVARELLRTSETAREERGNWDTAWAEAQVHPDHLLVCCSYCGQLRTGSGWVEIPAHIGAILLRARGITLSHGICPACLKKYHPEAFVAPDHAAFH